MKTMLLATVLGLAACGGPERAFEGDTVVAELSNGQPSCSQGVTGPTLHTRTATGTDANGQHYEATIVQCEWTCGNINGLKKAFVYVLFATDSNGQWTGPIPYADTIGAVGKIACP